MAQVPAQPASDPVEDVLELLRGRGGRVTTARRSLLEALFCSGGHRTAEDLAVEVQSRVPDVHLSTIYRNLDELERLGVISHTHLGHGPATYHLSSSPHGHLVCEHCGFTVEAPEELFEGLSLGASSRFGFVIDPRHFAVFGTCSSCAELRAADASGSSS
ncbi:MAG: Fur family transcriptional regulator [Acidimicrobiales bacterium]